MHSKPTRADSAAVAARAGVIVLDTERRTCPQCGADGLCQPLKTSFRDACNVIVAARRDQARDDLAVAA